MTAERGKIETGSVNARILYGLEGWVDENLNPRVDGFSKLNGVDARVPPLAITPATLFNEWRENGGSFEEERKRVLEGELEILLASSPTRTLMIRQAYKVPGNDKPFGIRSSAASVEKALSSIEDHFAFFREQGYDQNPDAESVVFIYGRIDPPRFPEVPGPSDPLPRGGMAAKTGDNIATVYGTDGDNETTTVFQPDVWTVVRHPDGMFEIIDEKIAQKRHMLIRPPSGERPDKVAVPEDRQLRPSLTPAEIQEAARVVLEVSDKAGIDQRVEYAIGLDVDGQLKMFFLESAPYERVESDKDLPDVIEGSVDFIIDSASDTQELLKRLEKGDEFDFVCVTPGLVAGQEEAALLDLEGARTVNGEGLKILYPGAQGTTHRDQILRQVGHRTFLYGVSPYAIGDRIEISKESSGFKIKNLSRERGSMILSLDQGFLAGLESVGGKGLRLSEVAGEGIATPGGFVITTEVMRDVLSKSGMLQTWRRLVESGSEAEALELAERIREKDLIFPEELSGQIEGVLAISDADSLYVRSSAIAEDDPRANFAGKYDSVEEVAADIDAVSQAYSQVVKSAFSESVIKFALANNVSLERATQIAVLVQPDVKPLKSGVAFRKSPDGMEYALIEGVRGKAGGVVTGRRSPDRVAYSPETGSVIKRSGPEVLTDSQISAVAKMTVVLSRMFGAPQDVEWAFNQEGQLIVLQSRDQR